MFKRLAYILMILGLFTLVPVFMLLDWWSPRRDDEPYQWY